MIYYRLLDRVICSWGSIEALENSGNFPRFSPPQTMLVAGNFLISSKLNYFCTSENFIQLFSSLESAVKERTDEDGSVWSVQLSPFGQSFN